MPNGLPTQTELVRELVWRYGRPAELWLSHSHLAANLIKKHRLKALTPDEFPFLPLADQLGGAVFAGRPESGKRAMAIRWPLPFPGGIRIPHLHFKGDVYLVKAEQWREFSQAVVGDVQERLADTKGLGFDETLQLGQAAASLNR